MDEEQQIALSTIVVIVMIPFQILALITYHKLDKLERKKNKIIWRNLIMALIYCRNCGKQISDKAPSCPHCGAAVSAAQQSEPIIYGSPIQKPKKHTGVIVGVIVALIAVASIIAAILIPVKVASDEHTTNTYSSNTYTSSSTGGYSYSYDNDDDNDYSYSYDNDDDNDYSYSYDNDYSNVATTYDVSLTATAEPSKLGYNPFGLYNVDVYVDGTYVGTIPNIGECLTDESIGAALGDDEALNEKSTTINMKLSAGKHDLKFISSDNENVCAEGYYIDIDRSCTLRYRLICRMDEIEVRK